jgi:hypothetical protein
VQVYDPTLTTNRGSANVLLVDPFNSLIQVDTLPAGTSVNDVIVHDGLTGAQPTSLFGILYRQSNATTGTRLNLNRATYPMELATPVVNGNNSASLRGRCVSLSTKCASRWARIKCRSSSPIPRSSRNISGSSSASRFRKSSKMERADAYLERYAFILRMNGAVY